MTGVAAVALEQLHRFNRWFEPPAVEQQSRDHVRGVRVTGYFSDESGTN